MSNQTSWQLKWTQSQRFPDKTMTPTKASPTVPMPEQRFPSVRALFCETKMSDRDFRIFTVRS